MNGFAEDRREDHRHLYKTTAVCQRADEPEVIGQILNISYSGILILIRGDFPLESTMNISLRSYRQDPIAELDAVVRWRQVEAKDVARLGIKFSRRLTPQELEAV